MFCEAVALDPLRVTAFAFAVARLAVCFSFGAMTSRVDDDTITQEGYAGRGLSQSCNAIAVASEQNAMHMAINANTHKRQPASAPTSFFVTCVLLTYFRIPWHAGRASAYCGRYFAFTRLFILIKAPLALSSILPSARVLRSRFMCLPNNLC